MSAFATLSDREIITRVHNDIVRHQTWCMYSALLFTGPVEITTTETPTAATDGWTVWYNPQFLRTLTRQQARFLVLHEQGHKHRKHLTVYKDMMQENPQLANIAMDMQINLDLVDTDNGAGWLAMPPVGVQPDAQYRGWSARQIFNHLKNNPDALEKIKQEAGGGEGQMDEHRPGDAGGAGDPKTAEERATEIERALHAGNAIAAARAKMAGKGAGNTAATPTIAPTVHVDWRALLRDWLTDTCTRKDDSSWARPNRRLLAAGTYFPGPVGEGMRELVVALDTSGSCFGSEIMGRFVAHIERVVADLAPDRVHVLYWDTAVAAAQTFDNGAFAVQSLRPSGGGGTAASCVFDYVRAKRINADGIIVLTDGLVGDWGTTTVPTLWAITTPRIRAPFGRSIPLE